MNELHITLYQQDIIWGDPEANRRRVEETLASLHSPALPGTPLVTDIFVVPETFTTGFGDHMAALAKEQNGPTLQWARRMAAQYDILFIGTWIVRESDKCYNRLHWVFPDGSFGYYDKAHTFRPSGEYNIICRGTRREVFEYKGWRIKPAVCYDLRFPRWLRNDNMEYDLLLVCANWPGSRHEAWTTLLKARAIENLCYVLGCNRSGVDGVGGKYTGNSAIIDYKGLPLAEAEAGADQTVSFTLDKDKLDTFRKNWPLYLDFD